MNRRTFVFTSSGAAIGSLIGPAADPLAFERMKALQSSRGNSVILHELYFDGLALKETSPGTGLRDAIAKRFGSLDRWAADFVASAKAAAGWAMLVSHPVPEPQSRVRREILKLRRLGRGRATVAVVMPRAWLAAIAGLEVACSRPAIPREITVVGSDYAFSVPDTLPPGPAVIHYRQNGAVAHEMIFGRLRAGGSPAEFADSLAHGGSVGRFVDGGTVVLFGAPVGDQVDLSLAIDLKPGRNYVLLGTLTDGPRNTPHVRLGMFKGLVVRSP